MQRHFLRLLPFLVLVAACGGDSGGGEPAEEATLIKWVPSGDNQSDTVGQTMPLSLRVKVTVDGVGAAGHEVVWSGPGTFGTPSMMTPSNGIAMTTWTLPTTTGEFEATATVIGATGSPITFSATAVVGPATQLVKVSGDNQSTVIGDIFNAPFTLRVADQYGNGKEGVFVHWSVVGSATLLVDSSPSVAFGLANGYLTAKDSIGGLTLTGTVTGLTGSPQVFHATVIGSTETVLVKNNFFEPSALTIDVGEAVQWKLIGSGHTVTSTGGGVIPSSGVMSAGTIWGPVLFTDPGIYTYECSEHPAMTGSITVNP